MVVHTFLFFLRAKTHRSGQDAETQRNYGALGLTFRRGGKASLLCAFPTLQPAPQNYGAPYYFFFFSHKDLPAVGRPARRGGRKKIVDHS